MEETNALIEQRRAKLAGLRAKGVDPFMNKFTPTHGCGDARGKFEEGIFIEGTAVAIAGRLTAHRDMGKSQFVDLKDVTGRIQVFAQKQVLGDEQFDIFKHLDLADFIGAQGTLFRTKTGEPSVRLLSFTVLAKALRPPPAKWHGLEDTEIRYRQRYLDLIANDAVMHTFLQRSAIIREIRNFFHARGYVEVETPMMQAIPGGAAAQPFKTYHNALGMPLTLRIAPELFLKRLLVGGFTKIFELNRSFRNEGISRRHNPEFTMLEAYWAFSDFEEMADLVEELTCHLAEKFCGGLQIEHKDDDGNVTRTIDLARPWKRASYHDLIKLAAGADFFDLTADGRRVRCEEKGVQISVNMADHEVIQQVFEKLVEEKTFDPCFVTRVSSELVPLAKISPGGQTVEVYELIINGQEISPGYSELNDPDVQRQRLEAQSGEETQKIDYDFIETLECGMPPAGGIGIGLDRLCMMLTGAPTIRDVVLFPLLKRKD